MNIFSLVERFMFKPSSNEANLLNPPPRLLAEIQYWAGVIMRNACRKDDSRGGIQQCANSKFLLFVFGWMLKNHAQQCFVDVGNSTRESSPSVEDAARPSTVEENVRALPGVKVTDSSVARGIRMKMEARGHHRPDSAHQLQVMDETGDMRVILNGDNAAALGSAPALLLKFRREQRERRGERERERSLQELGHDIAQRLGGS